MTEGRLAKRLEIKNKCAAVTIERELMNELDCKNGDKFI